MANGNLEIIQRVIKSTATVAILSIVLGAVLFGYIVWDIAKGQGYSQGYADGVAKEKEIEAAVSETLLNNARLVGFNQGFLNARNTIFETASSTGEVVVGISPEDQITLVPKQ